MTSHAVGEDAPNTCICTTTQRWAQNTVISALVLSDEDVRTVRSQSFSFEKTNGPPDSDSGILNICAPAAYGFVWRPRSTAARNRSSWVLDPIWVTLENQAKTRAGTAKSDDRYRSKQINCLSARRLMVLFRVFINNSTP